MKITLEEQLELVDFQIDNAAIIRELETVRAALLKLKKSKGRELALNHILEAINTLDTESKPTEPVPTENTFPEPTRNVPPPKSLDIIPLNASTHQEITYPAGSLILGVVLHNRIPSILYLRGSGTTTQSSTVSMLRIGQKTQPGSITHHSQYLGSLQLAEDQKPFYFILN